MLYLIRHTEAGEAQRDDLRKLTEKGRAEAALVGRYFRLNGGPLEFWHSPLVRARETAEIVAREMRGGEGPGAATLKEVEGLTPEDQPETIARRLPRGDLDVALVGHNPHLTRLASLLVKGDADAPPVLHLVKGGTVCLGRMDSDRPFSAGHWTIVFYVWPPMLRRLGGG